jgi:hypothetical protein
MSQPAQPRWDLDRLWWGLALALTVGICGYWPYLQRENLRLESWEILAIWSSEFTALFWFLWYGLSRLRQKHWGLDARRISRLTCQWVIVSTGISLGVDWAITLRSRSIERVAYERAAIADGEIVACDPDVDWFGLKRQYTLECRFMDRNQVVHQVTFVLAGRDTRPALAQALALGVFPMALPILYDPDHPYRSWVAGLPLHRQDGNRLYQMSSVAVLFNGLLFANLALWAFLLEWPEEMVPMVQLSPVVVITFLLWMGLVIDQYLRLATRRWWG